jgi:pimeloyl-ACP methyl ester carboxylesterase
MMRATVHGVEARMVTTSRLTTRILTTGADGGTPVLFLHGNMSSATWWEDAMVTLPQGYRAIAPDQRGFGDADPTAKIDATRGMQDLADDVWALLNTLGLERAHVIGNSLGGSVVWSMLADHPHRLLSATLVAPGSPYGVGGTKGIEGTACSPDFAGSGAGLISRSFLRKLEAGERNAADPFDPRAVLRSNVFRPPFVPAREEDLLSAMLAVHLGPQDLPGDTVRSANWPYFGPGSWGATNALSPRYAIDPARILRATPKPPILWIRGADDLAVADAGVSDAGSLGKLGVIPGWPGDEAFPPSPAIAQTRGFLGRYLAAGGWYEEHCLPGCAHVPFIEKLPVANALLHVHLRSADRGGHAEV